MIVFISYASEQQPLAEQIALALREEHHEVFFDRSELPEGDGYNARIREAVLRCHLFVFLLSPEAVAEGRYTLTELKFAEERWPSPAGRVLPVAVRPTDKTLIPPYLLAVVILRPQGNVAAEVVAAAERCGPEGLPRIMITLFPYEFVDRGSEILVRAELYDTERIVHMDRTAPPADEPRSVLGYSVGQWRDGALVIQTSLINWPYFDQIGTPLSENARVEERYTLAEDQTRLDVEITVTDPTTFQSPAIIRNSWFAYGDTIRRYDCQKAN